MFWNLKNRMYINRVNLDGEKSLSLLFIFLLLTSNRLYVIVSPVFVTQVHMYGCARTFLYARRPFNSIRRACGQDCLLSYPLFRHWIRFSSDGSVRVIRPTCFSSLGWGAPRGVDLFWEIFYESWVCIFL